MRTTVPGLLILVCSLAAAEPSIVPLPACQPETDGPEEQMALCEHNAGAVDEANGENARAEAHYLRAHSIWEQLGPESSFWNAVTLSSLGRLYTSDGKLADAEKNLTRALTLARTVEAAHPMLPVVIGSRLGALYGQTGLPERGRPLLDESIAKLRAAPVRNVPELAYACNALAMLDLWTRSYATAETLLREAISLATQDPGDDSPEIATYQANLGVALYLQGRNDQAAVLLHRARFLMETKLGPDNLHLGNVLAYLTSVETALGEFPGAEADALRAIAILSRLRDPHGLEVASAKVLLGTLYLRQGKTAEAERILPEAVEAERRLASDPRAINPRVLADAIRRLGQLRVLQGNWHDAQPLYRESLALYESNIGLFDPVLAPVLTEYANVLKHNGAPRAEVKSLEARAKAIKS
jgi:tetratricopeptide (TPR) repeat protein